MSAIEAVYADGVFRPTKPVDIREGERVDLEIKRRALTREEAQAQVEAWGEVYEGLTAQEIDEIEGAMLDRSRFFRPATEE